MLEILACVEPHRTGAFQQLADLVARHGNETSALICVLLAWDRQRQELAGRMLRAGIPVLALVIGANADELAVNPGPLAGMPERLVALPLDAIQATLDGLSARRRAA
jgi:hypothetical protein